MQHHKIRRSEERAPFPIPGLAADILHMRVKEGSKIRNLLRFATARMQGEGEDGGATAVRQVVFTGLGRGITKTITCVEILKRKVAGLHQLSKLCYMTVNEIWESPQQDVAGRTVARTVPAICILLSKDPLDPQELGYQPPQTLGVPTEEVVGPIPASPCHMSMCPWARHLTQSCLPICVSVIECDRVNVAVV
uniref:Ribonuclease P and MRP subunit p25 n=1 Tax=Fundulus heteroclitus TaxID=8078 RepID=A0A3Q2T315_FUNHE